MTNLPKHIALIPDGNRRWAKQHNLPSIEGHRRGMERLKQVVEAVYQHGISSFTVWGFSNENWSREETEKDYLFKLFNQAVDEFSQQVIQHQAAFHHLGRKDRLPQTLVNKLQNLEQTTQHFTERHLNVALDYGGRDEILRVVSQLLQNGLEPHQLTEQVFSQHLDTAGQPDPDLIIRTSGEQRTSGLMPWQATYAELYFTQVHLPDFTTDDLDQALQDYSARQRRFGK